MINVVATEWRNGRQYDIVVEDAGTEYRVYETENGNCTDARRVQRFDDRQSAEAEAREMASEYATT